MLNSVLTDSMATEAPSPRATASPAGFTDIAELYDTYGGLAFTLAHRIVNDRGVAEDVVQEAFLSLWKNAARFDAGRASVRTWLCRIVRNGAIDRLRGTAARQRSDQSLDVLASLCSSEDVVADVLRADESRAVSAALAGLPPAQREAIELAYYGGYTQSEIATLTSQPLGTVKGRTRLAMRALATALAPLRFDEPGRPAPVATGMPVAAAG